MSNEELAQTAVILVLWKTSNPVNIQYIMSQVANHHNIANTPTMNAVNELVRDGTLDKTQEVCFGGVEYVYSISQK